MHVPDIVKSVCSTHDDFSCAIRVYVVNTGEFLVSFVNLVFMNNS